MTSSCQLPRWMLVVVLVLSLIEPGHSQGRVFGNGQPMSNEGLRNAIAAMMSDEADDHSRAEILASLGPMNSWNVANITNMAGLFKGASSFLEDLSSWDTSRVTDMSDMFSGCLNMRVTPTLLQWNTSRVTSMARMFKSAGLHADDDLSALDTSSVTDMSYMFQGATFFHGIGLATWNVERVQYFNSMFSRATNFNADISQWNVTSAKFMEGYVSYKYCGTTVFEKQSGHCHYTLCH
jgi:surface protein